MENSLDTCMESCMWMDGYPCRIGVEESCRTSSCRFVGLELKNPVGLLRVE